MKYIIEGGELPVLNVILEKGEILVTEAGGMSWMSPNIKMETKAGGFGKAMGRMLSGESMFLNYYTALEEDSHISVSSSFPGSIIAIEIDTNKEFIAQKRAFLASQSNVELSLFFRKKIGTGLFGGEGFIMQRLSGKGVAFIEIDGTCVERELAPGEQLIVSTGHVAGFDATVTMEIKTVGGIKNTFFGGEGIFHTVLTGPGKVYLQTMPAFKFFPMTST